jgi:hypothetical protein
MRRAARAKKSEQVLEATTSIQEEQALAAAKSTALEKAVCQCPVVSHRNQQQPLSQVEVGRRRLATTVAPVWKEERPLESDLPNTSSTERFNVFDHINQHQSLGAMLQFLSALACHACTTSVQRSSLRSLSSTSVLLTFVYSLQARLSELKF